MTSQREEAPGTESIAAGHAVPVSRQVPDGGLGTSMPAWLRQPPAWKKPAVQATRRDLPAPDTSVIDPATMLDPDDLPRWLRELATAPMMPPAQSPPNASTETDDEPEEAAAHASSTMTWPQLDRGRAAAPEASSEAPVWAMSHNSDSDVAPWSPGEAGPPWWMSNVAIGILLLAIVLTMVYVILVASGAL